MSNENIMPNDIQPIIMPTWGLSMEEGKLVKWLVPEGATVTAGMEIAEIETSKITNVLEAQASGILRRQVIAEGESRACGTLIAVLAGNDVTADRIEAYVAEMAAAGAADAAETKPAPRMLDLGGGQSLRYCVAGEGGIPALLLHGFGGDLDNWQLNQPALARARAVYALDLPGHGESTKEVGGGDLASLAATVIRFMDQLDLGQVHLVGHSLGGGVALEIAAAIPARIASLSLLAPVGIGAAIDVGYPTDFLAAKKTRELQKCLARLFANPALMSREMVEQIARNKRLDGAHAALARIVAVNFATNHPPRNLVALAERMPIGIIWGAEDGIIPPDAVANLPAEVAMRVLPGIGHMPQLEAAEQLNGILEAWMVVAS